MTEDEALNKAREILSEDITVESGRELLKLKKHINGKHFSDLWSAFIASAPFEVVLELDN